MLVCTLGGEGGRGSEKVYCLYTHENVDIFGWTLTYIYTQHIQIISVGDMTVLN